MKKDTRHHLQYDWKSFVGEVPLASDPDEDMEYEVREDKVRDIIDAVVHEIDCYRNQSWWRRLLNLTPSYWLNEWLEGKEPEQYFWKPIWHNIRQRLDIK